ncbi:PEP-CTERM motif protein [Geobacter sp. OR-1]|uniref:PEP-CTERM sorting domain-containing protein n=1 Tax=Geobacter sp. OR-1 TaxID=1266765 RepID=UPI000543D2A6|nr:PEP-CTERM sorting domain-containing protein [Geobacter sp. OR-1]GAM11711.1 PEP-CTERM motif protein [Geobacter sp. OR-1]
MKRTILAALAMCGVIAAATSASAYSLSLNQINTTGYSGPYVNVTIDLTTATTATVKFDAFSPYLLVNGKIADLNVNASGFSVGSFTSGGGLNNFVLNSVNIDTNPAPPNQQVSMFGDFNLTISSQNASQRVDWLQFIVTNTSGTWASDDKVLTANTDGYSAAAHIFVPSAATNANTFFVGNGETPPSVPEPSTMLLLGSGFLGLAAYGRKRARK